MDPAARNASQTTRLWWTPKQIAETLQVTPRTVQRWIASGQLRVHRFGGTVRISAADFQDLVARSRG